MLITDVRTTKRGRKSIYVDGEFIFAVHKDAAAEFGLYKDEEVSEEHLNEALVRSNEIDARQKAFRLLSARSYTSNKLKEKLSEHGGEVAKSVTEDMLELGLIDDEDFARRYAEKLYSDKFYAPIKILYSLTDRGVPSDIARDAAGFFDKDENPLRAADYLIKKYPCLDEEKDKNKAGRSLMRLGYSGAEIKKAFALFECRKEPD